MKLNIFKKSELSKNRVYDLAGGPTALLFFGVTAALVVVVAVITFFAICFIVKEIKKNNAKPKDTDEEKSGEL